ncbi:MAG: IS1595 family transposase [Alicyclobacillaceae bacterium]|nr:IS1595 family transposase [Alicyclobacillaceae bacterium]
MFQRPMTLLEFQAKFPTDDACRNHLFSLRFPDGFRCPRCGHDRFYVIRSRHLLQCQSSACRHQTSLTVGTIFEKSRTPLRKWFWAIFLASHDKRGISALTLAREIDVTYKTAWAMLHKIRHAMRTREQSYKLGGIVEVDETYVGGPGENPKPGRGTNKTPTLVALSLSPDGKPGYLRMQAVENVKGETIAAFLNQHVEKEAIIVSDGFPSYAPVAQDRPVLAMKFDPKNNPDHMKWLHRAVSNAKTFLLGTYHGIKGKHLQAYLSEYTYRYNRRHFQGEWFNRLLQASISASPITVAELTG